MPEITTPTPSTDAAIAASLYPDTPEPTPKGGLDKPNILAAEKALFPTGKVPALDPVPPEVAAIRKENVGISAAGAFKGQTAELSALIVAADPLATPEAVAKATLEMKQIALDIGANGDDLGMLTSLAKAAIANPPTNEAMAAEARATSALLRDEHGDDFSSRLADANKLLQRDPRLNAFIKDHGLQNNERVVRRVIELARVERSAGRLK